MEQVGRKNLFLQASEGTKVVERVLLCLIHSCAPAVGGSLAWEERQAGVVWELLQRSEGLCGFDVQYSYSCALAG